MHPSFEGDHDLKTVMMKAETILSPDEEDPEGKGRKRWKDGSVRRSQETVTTGWDEVREREEWWGSIALTTSLAPVTLSFLGAPKNLWLLGGMQACV